MEGKRNAGVHKFNMERRCKSMVGERLYDLRKDAGLTQKQLGEILNVNHHSISSYERNKSEPPDIVKIKIAQYFRVSMDYLLGLSEDKQPYPLDNQTVRLLTGFSDFKRREVKNYILYLNGKDEAE